MPWQADPVLQFATQNHAAVTAVSLHAHDSELAPVIGAASVAVESGQLQAFGATPDLVARVAAAAAASDDAVPTAAACNAVADFSVLAAAAESGLAAAGPAVVAKAAVVGAHYQQSDAAAAAVIQEP